MQTDIFCCSATFHITINQRRICKHEGKRGKRWAPDDILVLHGGSPPNNISVTYLKSEASSWLHRILAYRRSLYPSQAYLELSFENKAAVNSTKSWVCGVECTGLLLQYNQLLLQAFYHYGEVFLIQALKLQRVFVFVEAKPSCD